MSHKLIDILAGWKNYIFKNPEIEKLAKDRAKICSECDDAHEASYLDWVGDDIEEVEGMACDVCSCPLSTLLRAPDSHCPKWEDCEQ